MSRPQRCRRVCGEPEYGHFAPDGIAQAEEIALGVDEFEAIRLVDHEGLTHAQCAERMGVSRTTVTELYERARRKIADCLVNGKRLAISGGRYRVEPQTPDRPPLPKYPKGETIMRIAVTYENGMIFQHFGHTSQFKLYDIENGKILSQRVVDTMGSGHGALAGFLKLHSVDALICGGIGGGAQMALSEAGIALYGGVSGEADKAVEQLLAGNLEYFPGANCDHHGAGHNCADHECGHNCH